MVNLKGNKMLKFDNASKVFITGCTHFFHKNICKGCSEWPDGGMRNFDCPIKMTEQVIKNINDRVKEDDILLHLGDFSFGGIDNVKKARDMINCKTIYLWLGNHCHHIEKEECKKLFTATFGTVDDPQFTTVRVAQNKYILGHYPMLVWNKCHHLVRQLHSHCHDNLPDNPNALRIDVGVDCHNLSPLSFVDVEAIIARKAYKPIDHHKDRSQE